MQAGREETQDVCQLSTRAVSVQPNRPIIAARASVHHEKTWNRGEAANRSKRARAGFE